MVHKTTYTYVVYHDEDDKPQSIKHAINEAYDGGMVGAVTSATTEPVDYDRLQDELISIGNDGTFFEEM
jgi:hypothetical protein